MKPVGAALALAPALALLVGCSDGLDSPARLSAPIVYGEDGRGEYFAGESSIHALFAQSSVALIPNRLLDSGGANLASLAPTWGARDHICSGEPFADQPTAAFCSGVLVDWDLVLTSGHCLRVLDRADFSVVFDYYYRDPADVAGAKLALGPGSLATAVEIVAEKLDPPGERPRLDYGWLRLASPVDDRFRPAAIHTRSPSLQPGDAITTIGSPHGVPLKFDATGVVEALGEDSDFFVARTDTSGGWSGGAAYDANLAVVGILARGGDDLVDTPEGCNAENRVPPTDPTEEQFTYANRALEGLCLAEPARAICSLECESPCQAGPRPSVGATPGEGGCSLSAVPAPPFNLAFAVVCLWLAARIRRRARGQLARAHLTAYAPFASFTR